MKDMGTEVVGCVERLTEGQDCVSEGNIETKVWAGARVDWEWSFKEMSSL